MVTKVSIMCPTCLTPVTRQTWIPFVVLHTTCKRCGTRVAMVNPQYTRRRLAKLPRCLDCGDPIPKIQKPKGALYRPNLPLFGALSHTCPACWVKHRNEEPGGDDLDIFVRRWWRAGLDVAKSVRRTRVAVGTIHDVGTFETPTCSKVLGDVLPDQRVKGPSRPRIPWKGHSRRRLNPVAGE